MPGAVPKAYRWNDMLPLLPSRIADRVDDKVPPWMPGSMVTMSRLLVVKGLHPRQGQHRDRGVGSQGDGDRGGRDAHPAYPEALRDRHQEQD